MDKKRKMVYIASPYTIGDKIKNVNYQIAMFSDLLHFGFVPFAPLLTHFINIQNPQSYETWLEYDFEVIRRCDALLACRMTEKSSGRDREIVFAKEHKIPVFMTTYELCSWRNNLDKSLTEPTPKAKLELKRLGIKS